MEITSVIGYEYFKSLNGHQTDSLTNFGKMNFTTNTLNGGRSRFKFETVNGRTWLSSVPTTGDRSEDRYYDNTCTKTERYWVSTGNYSWSGYYKTRCVRRRGWRTDWSDTYAKRMTDSSRRTPSFNVSIDDLISGDVESRYVTFGIRLQYPDMNHLPPDPLSIVRQGGDVDHQDIEALLLDKSEIPNKDGAVVYIEAVVDRYSGHIRRWIDDVEVGHKVLRPTVSGSLNNYYFSVGGKSTERYSSNPPPNGLYRVNDIYVAVTNDPSDVRLGPIEVKDLSVENFQLNRHWLPPSSSDTPTETTNRVKTDDAPKNEISGDTHADPGEATMAKPTLNLDDEEVLYVEIDVYGHADGENGANFIDITTLDSDVIVSDVRLPLNVDKLPSIDNERRVYTYNKTPGQEENPLEDLRLKVTFSQ